MKYSPVPVLLMLLATFAGCQYIGNDTSEEKAIVPQAPPPAMQVEGYAARAERLENIINATGSLLPNESVGISPERAGKLTDILFRESSQVKAGDLLAKIDDQELVAQLTKLKVQERIAMREEERAIELRKIEAIPQDEFERLQNTREQIQAEMKLLEVQIQKTEIRAPFSGLIGLRNLSLGAYVTPSESIADLQQTDPLKLEFDVPEKYMRQVNKGQKVAFDIVGFDQPFEAEIYATSVEVTPTTRTFKVRARSSNPNGLLRPGNFAKVEVITGVNEEAIMVPSDAVVPSIEGQKVFVARSGQVVQKMVETGIREGIMIEIVTGLMANDTVIVSGLLALSDGMVVKVSNLVDYNTHLN
ncbi:MAG: efflux RND transporter periplasmic adaptor subunit [Saprospiraceae bacterium]|nr:efflux RND transporter periplasmic adaptor subunit [Saprospiraceae bacterium]